MLMTDILRVHRFNPDNWQTMVEGQQERQSFFLDSERVPCNGDDVQLPAGHTFQIGMPSGLKEAILLKSFQVGQLVSSVNKQRTRSISIHTVSNSTSGILDLIMYMKY